MDISIVIPTKNRFHYVSKLINYYESINFDGVLILIDSSDPEIIIQTQNLIDTKKNLTINYIKYPGDEISAKALICSDIKTKYVIQAGDDDYYSVLGFKKIITFLDSNVDYASAAGYGYAVGYNVKKNVVKGIRFYSSVSSEKESAHERIEEIPRFPLRKEVSDYTVFRTEVFKKIFTNIWYDSNLHISLRREYWEHTFTLYKYLYGKSAQLKIFFIVRFITSSKSPSWHKPIEKIYFDDRKSFFKAYFFVMKKMINACNNFEDINDKKVFLIAKSKIKEIILYNINISKKRSISYFHLNRSYMRLSKILKSLIIAGFFRIIRFNRSKIDILSDRKSSKYNNEFAKIIEGILK